MAEGQAPATCAPPSPALAGRPLRVGFLHNPLSGGNRGRPGALEGVLAAHPEVRRLDVDTPASVTGALADFARERIGLVAINGGDGTVQAVLTALRSEPHFESPPLLAVLAAGTTSMIAGDVGLRGRRAAGLARLLDWARAPDGRARLVTRPVLRLEPTAGAAPFYGMFFGTAAIEQGIRFCRERVHTMGVRGELGAGLALAALLLALMRGRPDVVSPLPLTTAIDAEPCVRRDHLVLLVTTLERLVVGLRPFWGVGPGSLHYTAVLGRPRRLLMALPRVLRGRAGGPVTADNGYVSREVSQVRLWLEGTGYTLDGELFTSQPGRGPVVLGPGGHATFVRC